MANVAHIAHNGKNTFIPDCVRSRKKGGIFGSRPNERWIISAGCESWRVCGGGGRGTRIWRRDAFRWTKCEMYAISKHPGPEPSSSTLRPIYTPCSHLLYYYYYVWCSGSLRTIHFMAAKNFIIQDTEFAHSQTIARIRKILVLYLCVPSNDCRVWDGWPPAENLVGLAFHWRPPLLPPAILRMLKMLCHMYHLYGTESQIAYITLGWRAVWCFLIDVSNSISISYGDNGKGRMQYGFYVLNRLWQCGTV